MTAAEHLYNNMDGFLAEWHSPNPTLTVYTSGSTGLPKLIEVEKARMEASAICTCTFLGIPKGATALLCLPTRYIAGMMMVVRAQVWPMSLLEIKPNNRPMLELNKLINQKGITIPHFVAVTPAQAYESLKHPQERETLLNIPCLLIGGGNISSELEEMLKVSRGEVWSSYGMTETLSHVALRRIGESGYKLLPGVSAGLSPEGCLWIDAPKVCTQRILTNDIAEFNADGTFCIIGRIDNTICSGGLKLQIESMEMLLSQETSMVVSRDFILTWISSAQWGQALTLLHKRNGLATTNDNLKKILPYLKYIIEVDELPMTPTGKASRKRAHEMAERLLTDTV